MFERFTKDTTPLPALAPVPTAAQGAQALQICRAQPSDHSANLQNGSVSQSDAAAATQQGARTDLEPSANLPKVSPPRRTGMDVMASGFVHLTAEERTDRDGKPYTRAVMAVVRDGLPPLHVRLVSHVPKVSFSLQAMEAGEMLSVSGNLLLTDTGSVVINARRLLTATPNTRHNPNPNWSKAA